MVMTNDTLMQTNRKHTCFRGRLVVVYFPLQSTFHNFFGIGAI